MNANKQILTQRQSESRSSGIRLHSSGTGPLNPSRFSPNDFDIAERTLTILTTEEAQARAERGDDQQDNSEL